MTGKRTNEMLIGTAAALILVASPSLAANRGRAASGSAAPAVGAPAHDNATASSEPRSVSEYKRLIKDGGSLTGGPLVFRSTAPAAPQGGRLITAGTRSMKSGGTTNVKPLEALPCGTYSDPVAYETEQGPFARGLGNLEDYELTNATPGSLCVTDDATADPDIDCRASADPTGFFCAGNAVDAGDILTGLGNDNAPNRGAGWWEMLVIGSGFSGNPSKYVLPNYFGDTNEVSFPLAGDPSGCGAGAVLPTTAGFDIMAPFGSSGATITVTLADGSQVVYGVPSPDADGKFFALCCSQGIQHISMADDDGVTLGIDNMKWGQTANPCPVTLEPVTLEILFEGLECLEMKLDNLGTGTSSN